MSIVHLANDLGLSVSTVSRALNGYTDVSDSTRQRVALRAQELGYKPHPGARRLKSGKSGAIGVVLPSISQGGQFIDAMYASLLGGMAMVLEAEGYTLMATSHGPCTDEQELGLYENFIRGGWFDAFVIVRTRLDDPRVALVQSQKIPFVTYGRCRNADSFAWVDTDNEQAFYLGAQRQLAFGHRDIALINGPSDYTFAQLRRAGYERALEEAGIAVRPEWVVQGPVTEGSGYQLAQALLNLPQPPAPGCVPRTPWPLAPWPPAAIAAWKWAATWPSWATATASRGATPIPGSPPSPTMSTRTAAMLPRFCWRFCVAPIRPICTTSSLWSWCRAAPTASLLQHPVLDGLHLRRNLSIFIWHG